MADGPLATNNRAVFIAATTENLPPEMQNSLMIWAYVLLALMPIAVMVFSRLLWRIEHDGPRTRPDLFALPEIMAICMVFALLFLPPAIDKVVGLATHRAVPPTIMDPVPNHVPPAVPIGPEASKTPDAAAPKPADPNAKPEEPAPGNRPLTVNLLLQSMLALSLPALAVLVIAKMRGGRLRDMYTPRRVPVIDAVGMGVGLGVLALCLAALTKFVMIKIVGPNEPQQRLVLGFEKALSGGDQGVVWAIAVSAVVVAPICEEILFRGSLYPVLARVMGRGLSACVAAGIFALAHDTLTDAPSLAVLALCFTIGYEFTGSLVVSIVMHATFNGLNLLQQWMR